MHALGTLKDHCLPWITGHWQTGRTMTGKTTSARIYCPFYLSISTVWTLTFERAQPETNKPSPDSLTHSVTQLWLYHQVDILDFQSPGPPRTLLLNLVTLSKRRSYLPSLFHLTTNQPVFGPPWLSWVCDFPLVFSSSFELYLSLLLTSLSPSFEYYPKSILDSDHLLHFFFMNPSPLFQLYWGHLENK